MKKKLAGAAFLLVAAFGAQALLAPMPNAAPCNGRHYRYCTIEPDSPIPTCPPCEYWEWCGPQCGCRKIAGCKP